MANHRLDTPAVINAREVLETVSYLRALYIMDPLISLEKGNSEKAAQQLERGMERVQEFIEEIKEVMEKQGQPYPSTHKKKEDGDG